MSLLSPFFIIPIKPYIQSLGSVACWRFVSRSRLLSSLPSLTLKVARKSLRRSSFKEVGRISCGSFVDVETPNPAFENSLVATRSHDFHRKLQGIHLNPHPTRASASAKTSSCTVQRRSNHSSDMIDDTRKLNNVAFTRVKSSSAGLSIISKA